jgi:hypothetical protein
LILDNWIAKLESDQSQYSTVHLQFKQLERDELSPGINRCIQCARSMRTVFQGQNDQAAAVVLADLTQVQHKIASL